MTPSQNPRLNFLMLMYHVSRQAVAYYYHGLVLDKGGEPASAVCCLSAADDLYFQRAEGPAWQILSQGMVLIQHNQSIALINICADDGIFYLFNCTYGRVPPPWGVMKNMHKEIPDVACKKFQVYRHLFERKKDR
jgi:hypothetical protein